MANNSPQLERAIFATIVALLAFIFAMSTNAQRRLSADVHRYPDIWFAAINDPNKPDWEIFPQEAKPGEVILSKRNELGILSNFAATPFVLDGKR